VEDVFLDNNCAVRSRTDTVPKLCWLFSEQTLRGVFQKDTSVELATLPGFAVKKTGTVNSLYFREQGAANLMCLTDENGCGCSGEIVEFLVTLSRRGFDSVIIYLPHECSDAAHAGVLATLHLPQTMRQQLSCAVLVQGFGGVASVNSEGEVIQW